MRPPLTDLSGRRFDAMVVGGGAAGASTAQNLASRGYETLLVDKGDFASGTSSRSSRLLYCGLAYLSPDYDLWRFAYRPRDLLQRLRMARLAMTCRSQLVETMPERLTRCTFFFPVMRGGDYPGWKVDLAYRALGLLDPGGVPLNYRRLPAQQAAREFGLVRLLDQAKVESVAVFDEYQYNWAERICLDTVLDAERCGATVRNYTCAEGFSRASDASWTVGLRDALEPGDTATVHARVLVNTAGPWADRVNDRAVPQARRRVVGIKGINVVVKLPDDCRGLGMETISSIGQPFYCMPWGRYHFLGPTETVFEGDPDDGRVLPDEVEFILREANLLYPALSLTRNDVVYAWCGVRPRTASSGHEGVKALTIHDMASAGMPNALTLTGTPIMMHRHAGRELAAAVARKIPASKPPQPLSYAARPGPDARNSPALSDEFPNVTLAHLQEAARAEHPQTLIDLLFRRVPVGWSGGMGTAVARRAAETVAPILGWSAQRQAEEVERYLAFVGEHFAPVALEGGAAPAPAHVY
jgi:glycerol-3-phosphate dehydrogenase